MKEVILSGIRPSGVPGKYGSLHLGNLFGAMLQFVDLVKNSKNKCLFFVADYHALTDMPDKGIIGKLTEHILLMYLALGLNINNSIIYVQSHVPEIMELDVIIRNFCTLGKLVNLPTFKSKLAKALKANGSQPVSEKQLSDALGSKMGLVNYPILMAADILAPQSTVVPVGEDQKAHIELAREIARLFNNHYGPVFTIPDIQISNTPKIPGLDGKGKMGKTDDNSILILDQPESIWKKLRKAKTDENRRTKNDAGDPEKCASIFPLHEIEALTPDFNNVMEIKKRCKLPINQGGISCVDCKKLLYKKLLELLGPIQDRYWEFSKKPDEVREIARSGAKQAREIIAPLVKNVKQAIGLYDS